MCRACVHNQRVFHCSGGKSQVDPSQNREGFGSEAVVQGGSVPRTQVLRPERRRKFKFKVCDEDGVSVLEGVSERHKQEQEPLKVVLDVFLGGPIGSTAWRTEVAAPMLEEAGMSFYDPGQSIAEEHGRSQVEEAAKVGANCVVLVFEKGVSGICEMMEAVVLICSGAKAVVCIEAFDGVGEDCDEVQRAREYLRAMAQKRGCPVFVDVGRAVRQAIHIVRNEEYRRSNRHALIRSHLGSCESSA
eukprot:TRINITY_DN6620_c0_g1_i1.p1 TRINITY_DN6620_c0_g1~~TRINITY_DN6620_c0_g1_i1.p1  ORF type:complete len:245 (+),score=62.20 TRINITY_DN6620_c0_g1_i1:1-735(+)